MKAFAFALALAGFATPAPGFGFTFGTPLEERVGGDYGPEYYRALQAKRCHTVRIKTRDGIRRVKRCS